MKLALGELERAKAWATHARGKRCVVCGAARPRGHHIVTQQKIRELAKGDEELWQRWRWDTRNQLALCDRHHMAHHNRHRPVTWQEMLAYQPKALQFARELKVEWWLEATYPGRP